jgi:spore coat polysaccharide biosynthesis protein SpsF
MTTSNTWSAPSKDRSKPHERSPAVLPRPDCLAPMTTAAIVQARMGSSRLPGKVVKDLSGRPVLGHVLARCASIGGVDVVVCAVPDEPQSDVLEAIALKSGAAIFRGSENDVLLRYLEAAQSVDADVVIRVTSDCPLIDPFVCAEVLSLREERNADYAANNITLTYPHGLDCEAMTIEALRKAHQSARDASDREHVTPWLRQAAEINRANLASKEAGLEHYRWTLDYPEDLAFLRAVFAALPANSAGRMNDVLSVLRDQPALGRINAMHAQGREMPVGKS